MKIDFRRHMNLLVGFFVTASLVVLAVSILMILATKGLFNPEYKLISVFNDGVGLRRGSAVLFNGVAVGAVDDVHVSPGIDGRASRVGIILTIDLKYRDFITSKSIAVVMRDKNLVSDRVINIETPELGGNILDPGDTLMVATTRDIETVLSSLNDLMGKVNNLINQAEVIVQKVNDTNTTLGAMLNSGTLYRNIEKEIKSVSVVIEEGHQVLQRTNRMGADVEKVLPKLLNGADTSMQRVQSTIAGLDSLVGRFGVLSKKLETVATDASELMIVGKNEMQSAGDLVDAVSDYWFIRGKISKKNKGEIPLMMGEGGP